MRAAGVLVSQELSVCVFRGGSDVTDPSLLFGDLLGCISAP